MHTDITEDRAGTWRRKWLQTMSLLRKGWGKLNKVAAECLSFPTCARRTGFVMPLLFTIRDKSDKTMCDLP